MRHPSLCVFPQNVPSTHPQNGRIRHGGAVAERNISICRSVPAVRVRQINTHTHVTDMFVCYMYSNDLDHDMSHTHTQTRISARNPGAFFPTPRLSFPTSGAGDSPFPKNTAPLANGSLVPPTLHASCARVPSLRKRVRSPKRVRVAEVNEFPANLTRVQAARRIHHFLPVARRSQWARRAGGR